MAFISVEGNPVSSGSVEGGAHLYLVFTDDDGREYAISAQPIDLPDDVEDAASDLAGLRAFDSNGDGALTAEDVRFAEFGIWRDIDSDGVVDDGETQSLAEAGIASFNLAGAAVDGTTQTGEVAIVNTGSFTLTSGETREFADAALTYFSAAYRPPSLQLLAAIHTEGPAFNGEFQRTNGALEVAPLPGWAHDMSNIMHLGLLTENMMERLMPDPDDRLLDLYGLSARYDVSGADLLQNSSEIVDSLSDQSPDLPTLPAALESAGDGGWEFFGNHRETGEPHMFGLSSLNDLHATELQEVYATLIDNLTYASGNQGFENFGSQMHEVTVSDSPQGQSELVSYSHGETAFVEFGRPDLELIQPIEAFG